MKRILYLALFLMVIGLVSATNCTFEISGSCSDNTISYAYDTVNSHFI